jgi:hypothetical protein
MHMVGWSVGTALPIFPLSADWARWALMLILAAPCHFWTRLSDDTLPHHRRPSRRQLHLTAPTVSSQLSTGSLNSKDYFGVASAGATLFARARKIVTALLPWRSATAVHQDSSTHILILATDPPPARTATLSMADDNCDGAVWTSAGSNLFVI